MQELSKKNLVTILFKNEVKHTYIDLDDYEQQYYSILQSIKKIEKEEDLPTLQPIFLLHQVCYKEEENEQFTS